MKKTIKSFSVIALGLLLLTSACKKNPVPTNTGNGETTIAVQQAGRAADESTSQPNATLEISESLFNELNRGNPLQVKQVRDNYYIAQNVLADATVPSTNPCTLSNIIATYNAFMAANMPIFQSWANANCQSFLGCWCYCGMCITYQINPSYPPCIQVPPQYKPTIGLFTEIPS